MRVKILPTLAPLPLLTALLAPLPCGAFSLTPIMASVEPSGPGSSASFVVANDSDESVAAEVYALPREPDADGKESLAKAPGMDKLFMIYPPQLVLKPREKRTVRVSWIGDAKPASERAFRLIAEQLPVLTKKKPRKGGAQINVLLKYAGALYVTPKDAKPELSVREAVPAGDPKKPSVAVTLENRGTAHRVLTGFVMKVRSQSLESELALEGESLPVLNGQNVLAGRTRRFIVPIPAQQPLKPPVQVSFEFKE